ncbi:1226_t:CDS:2 [Acaulospora colombiana]|uniref:1226_t:CDS:1 n=1 Tax=Acaulospora colombiana TaxID=27376 RepID=A0ACA9MRG3_9GLOM|nr:1226_t:CDS:2 [Acaulospora colombiana]
MKQCKTPDVRAASLAFFDHHETDGVLVNTGDLSAHLDPLLVCSDLRWQWLVSYVGDSVLEKKRLHRLLSSVSEEERSTKSYELPWSWMPNEGPANTSSDQAAAGIHLTGVQLEHYLQPPHALVYYDHLCTSHMVWIDLEQRRTYANPTAPALPTL